MCEPPSYFAPGLGALGRDNGRDVFKYQQAHIGYSAFGQQGAAQHQRHGVLLQAFVRGWVELHGMLPVAVVRGAVGACRGWAFWLGSWRGQVGAGCLCLLGVEQAFKLLLYDFAHVLQGRDVGQHLPL